MEHIEHDYLSKQVIQILKISRAFHSSAVFTMQNVLPRSGARAYTVSDDASADQRYCNYNDFHKEVTTSIATILIIARTVHQ